MSYRTDQFYKINDAGERGYYFRENDPSAENSAYSNSGDNGKFMYPDRTVRTDDHSGRVSTTLKRGYMRSLRTQADGIEVAVTK